ncbi:MAG: YkgJ family cysteine cluster protein [Desulfobacteraceae bacterium]|jgi:Fe-S-cluster containining protein
MKNLVHLFRSYEYLVDKADAAFQRMEKEHGACIKCERHCADCCHAVFGLFLIEAAYLKQQFDQLGQEQIKAALLRCNKTEKDLKRLEKMLQTYEDDPNMQAYAMARGRVRCPLLDENEDCILYANRPITCRTYGIPTKIQGKARVCGKTEFRAGENYPVFDLDGIYNDLYVLSKELLESREKGDPEKASFLISVAKIISTPQDDLFHEVFEQSDSV